MAQQEKDPIKSTDIQIKDANGDPDTIRALLLDFHKRHKDRFVEYIKHLAQKEEPGWFGKFIRPEKDYFQSTKVFPTDDAGLWAALVYNSPQLSKLLFDQVLLTEHAQGGVERLHNFFDKYEYALEKMTKKIDKDQKEVDEQGYPQETLQVVQAHFGKRKTAYNANFIDVSGYFFKACVIYNKVMFLKRYTDGSTRRIRSLRKFFRLPDTSKFISEALDINGIRSRVVNDVHREYELTQVRCTAAELMTLFAWSPPSGYFTKADVEWFIGHGVNDNYLTFGISDGAPHKATNTEIPEILTLSRKEKEKEKGATGVLTSAKPAKTYEEVLAEIILSHPDVAAREKLKGYLTGI